MKDNATKTQFIELRALGHSYSRIAEQLNVSKQTLIGWSKDFQEDIANLRELEKEALRWRFKLAHEHRLQIQAEIVEKIKEELAKRDFSDVPTHKLLGALSQYIQMNVREDDTVCFSLISKEDSCLEIMNTLNRKTWVG